VCLAVAASAQTVGVNTTSLSFFAQAGGPVVTQTLQVTGSGNFSTSLFPFGQWLSVNPTGGTAPSALTVTANPAGLAAGTYQGQLAVFGPNLVPVPVSVTLTVSNVGASPSSLQFAYQVGAGLPAPQVITLSGASTTYNALASTTSGGTWLQVTPTSGTAPGTLAVSLVSSVVQGLATGTYNGTVVISPASNASISIPVTLTVSPAPPVTVSPTSVALNYQIGGSNNSAQQVVNLSTTGSQAVPFAMSLSVNNNPSGRTWFTVSPSTGGSIPAGGSTNVTFAYDSTANLPAGTWNGTAALLTPGGMPTQQTINVTLTVSTSPLLSLSTNALTFTYQTGTAVPAAQNVTVNSTSGAAGLSITSATATGGSWLSVAGAGTAGTAIPVSVSPTGLAPGTYTGTISVAAFGAANSPQTISVTLKVTNDPVIVVSANGCSTAVFNTCSLTFADQIGQNPPLPQSIQISSTTGATLNYTVAFSSTACGGNWLTVNPSSGSTSGFATIGVTTTGLAAATCAGTISISATNPATGNAAPNSPLSIPVSLYVSTAPLLVVNPSGLTFSTQVNGSTPPAQTISLNSTSGTDQLTYTVTYTTANGSNWLFVSPLSGTTALGTNAVQVLAVPGILSGGTYTGSVTITAAGPGGAAVADSPVTIPISFQVNAGTIAATPTSLNFTQVAGGPAPAPQGINVTGTPNSIPFSASAATDNGVAWLSVPTNGTSTPVGVQVSVNAGTLAVGTYTGKVILTAATSATGSPFTIPVTLSVVAAQTLAVSPATVNFSYTTGAAAPAAQTVAVSSTGTASPFTTAISTSATWLQVSPASGSTPANLSISVSPTSLTPGSYTGTVTVNSTAALQPATVTVNLTVVSPIPPVLVAIKNAASYSAGGLSPGENIVIGGTNMGPATLAGLALNSDGTVATQVGSTQVTFDGIAAPIVYVSATQSSVMVPYEIAGRATTSVRVVYKGTTSDPVVYNVVAAAPGIYTQNSQGTGPGSILNQNNSINGPGSAAPKDTVVAVYMTGEGTTTPPPNVTGGVAGSAGNGLKQPVLPVTATVGGIPANVEYAGSAPGIVYGVMQVNVRIPLTSPSGAVPIVINVGSNPTQTGVTVSVQ